MDKPYIHTYCVYKISQKKVSQTTVDTMCECLNAVVNQIFIGNRFSARIQENIA